MHCSTVYISICTTVPLSSVACYIHALRADIEGQKMALFSYIANNHKRLNITWDDIASVLRDMLNKGNLALDIEKKIKSSRRDSEFVITPFFYQAGWLMGV